MTRSCGDQRLGGLEPDGAEAADDPVGRGSSDQTAGRRSGALSRIAPPGVSPAVHDLVFPVPGSSSDEKPRGRLDVASVGQVDQPAPELGIFERDCATESPHGALRERDRGGRSRPPGRRSSLARPGGRFEIGRARDRGPSANRRRRHRRGRSPRGWRPVDEVGRRVQRPEVDDADGVVRRSFEERVERRRIGEVRRARVERRHVRQRVW